MIKYEGLRWEIIEKFKPESNIVTVKVKVKERYGKVVCRNVSTQILTFAARWTC